MSENVSDYMHEGGRRGRDRLRILSGVVGPTTSHLLDGLGIMPGWTAVDVGCGSGDVSFDLARRVGPQGKVIGLDMDEAQLGIVRSEAKERSLTNMEFWTADVREPWPVSSANLVYTRFVLTHLPDPLSAIRHAFAALKSGGIFVAEDVDMAGHTCHPPSPAFDFYYECYLKAARLRGGNPFIGLGLDLLFRQAEFTDVRTTLVQPFGREGDVKLIPELTMSVMCDGLVSASLAARYEVADTISRLEALRKSADTIFFMPRIFQVTGRRP